MYEFYLENEIKKDRKLFNCIKNKFCNHQLWSWTGYVNL